MLGIVESLASYASGSVSDVVFSRNAHGPYTRPRRVPVNPRTPLQQAARRQFSRAADRWARQLTRAQRLAWDAYAADRVVHAGTLKITVLTGQQSYVRANASRQQPGLGWVDDPPVIFRDPQWTRPSNVQSAGLGFIFYNIDPTDEWANLNGSAMVLFISDALSAGTNFHAGPWRRSKILRGFTGTPPAQSQFMVDPWGPTPAPRRWLRSYVFTGDGRVAGSRRQPLDSNV